MGRYGRQAHFDLRAFLPILAKFDTDGIERRPDGFLECLVFLSGRQGVAPRQCDHNQRLRDVRKLLVVFVLYQRYTAVNQVFVPPL
jgi:hypothetical protein